jgi:hypothetical protein
VLPGCIPVVVLMLWTLLRRLVALLMMVVALRILLT